MNGPTSSGLSNQEDATLTEEAKYNELLQVVENLKLENSSLKKELCCNTSQISRLESEATSLKEMVVKLNKSINPQLAVQNHDNNHHQNSVPASFQYGCFPFLDHSLALLSPHQLGLNFSPGYHTFSPPAGPSLVYAMYELRLRINNLLFQRYTILESLKREEITKERHMHQLNKLNDKLKSIADSDQPFPPSGEDTWLVLQSSIKEIQELMEHDLGTHDMMEQRTQDWLHQIRMIDFEIKKLQQQYNYLNSISKSCPPPAATLFSSRKSMMLQDTGQCRKINTYFRGSFSLTDVTTQTPKTRHRMVSLDIDKTLPTTPVPLEITSDISRLSRSTQTVETCFTNLSSPTSTTSSQGLRLGSVMSLPDHVCTGSEVDLSSLHSVTDEENMYNFCTALPSQITATSTGAKVDVFGMISTLGSSDPEDMSRTFYSLSCSAESSNAMRQSGCLQLLVQLLHDGSILSPDQSMEKIEKSKETRKLAAQALRNIVCSNTNKDVSQIESHILDHLEDVRLYCDALQQFACNRNSKEKRSEKPQEYVKFPSQSIPRLSSNLLNSILEIMRLSYQEPIRITINDLGGLFCMAELLVLHCRENKLADKCLAEQEGSQNSLLRQNAGLTLVNLTFGHSTNKALLLKMQGFLDTVTEELHNTNEEIQQAMASILRNLSWQAEEEGRNKLREKGVVKVLTERAIKVKQEVALNSMLSALWNLSGHCPQNRIDICAVEGSLAFLVSTLTYRSTSKVTHIIESGGGILRNVSSVVAKNESYRQILRDHDCLRILLDQLTSTSLTIVSNACGTLWNLSARDKTDQTKLWELGAVGKLRKLIYSKHKVIAQGSNAALRNLLSNQPENMASVILSSTDSKSDLPGLQARKMKQLESELKQATSQSTPELLESFSPRHHARESSTVSQSAIKPSATQRHSLQERSSASPARSKQQSGIFYSGSLGNLPQHAYNTNIPGRTIQAWESNKLGSKNTATETPTGKGQLNSIPTTQSSFAPAQYEAKPMYLAATLNSVAGASRSFNTNQISSGHWEIKPAKTWGNAREVPANKKAAARGRIWTPTNPESHTEKPATVQSPSGMPTDLMEKLRHANDDCCYQEDDAVNYSLRFTDEVSQSPALQSPEIYNCSRTSTALAKPLQTKVATTRQSTGPKVTFASSTYGGCGAVKTRSAADAERIRRTINSSVGQKLLYAGDEMYDTEDTPTNFSARYSEEQLYEVCREKFSLQSYPGEPLSVASENPAGINSAQDTLKDVASSTTSVRLSKNSEERIGKGPVDKNVVQNDASNHPSREEDDKFDTDPGTMASGLHIKSGRRSGFMTPRTPMYLETPMRMDSPFSSQSSLDTDGEESFHTDVESEMESRMQSGYISASDLPDSPGQSMPQSPCRSPKLPNESKQKKSQSNRELQRNPLKPNEKQSETAAKPVESEQSSLSNLTGSQLFSKVHEMSAGFLATLPQADEMKLYNAEPAMSVMTEFSGITVDGAKVKPITELKAAESIDASNSDNKDTPQEKDDNTQESDNRAIIQAGYVTSLPTSDEIKHFVCEGSMSPLTGLSEISALQPHNAGFQKSENKQTNSKKHGTSNRNSFASRSSATGASAPLPPILQQDETESDQNPTSVKDTSPKRVSDSSIISAEEEFAFDETEEDNLFMDSSSDDDACLSELIKRGMPKQKSSSSKTKSIKQQRSVTSFRPNTDKKSSTDKSKNQPTVSGESRDEVRAGSAGYVTSLPTSDEIKRYHGEGTLSPMTTLSEISALQSHNGGFEKPPVSRITKVISQQKANVVNETPSQPLESVASADSTREMVRKSERQLPSKLHSMKSVENVASTNDNDNTTSQISIASDLGTGRQQNKQASKLKFDDGTSEQTLSYSTQSEQTVEMNSSQDVRHNNRPELDSPTAVAGKNNGLTHHTPNGSAVPEDIEKRDQEVRRPVEKSWLVQNGMTAEEASTNGEDDITKMQSRFYGENPNHNAHDKMLNYGIEDTPCIISGNNSSLSSLDMESGEGDDDLLQDCISSAMPVARNDHNAALPPNQLLLMHNNNQNHYPLQHNSHSPDQINAIHSPNDAEWALVHDQANKAAAAMVVNNQDLSATTPLSLVSLSSPDQGLASFNVVTSHNTHVDNENFYRLSREPSLGDSDLSMQLGGDAKSLMKSQYANKPKIVKGRQSSDLSDNKPLVLKGGRKVYRSPITGKVRENLCYHAKDNASSRSSSSNNKKANYNSNTVKSTCSKCHSSHHHQLPMSSSLGRLEDTSTGRRYRKDTVSSYTKPMMTQCSQVREQKKPARSRSAHAGYQAGVTQLYPRIEQIDSVMLNGLASMAARGNAVLGPYEGSRVIPVVQSPYGYAIPRPVLMKQNTFIQDQPSPALLHSGAHNIPAVYKPVGKKQLSKSPKRQKSGATKEKVTLKKRLKKLLSPSEETKPLNRAQKKKQPASKKANGDKRPRNTNSDKKDSGLVNTNTWSRRKGNEMRETRVNEESAATSKAVEPALLKVNSRLSSNSSLTLSSSSAASESSGSFDTYQPEKPGKVIYRSTPS